MYINNERNDFMFADVGNVPAVMQTGGRDDGMGQGGWWLFAIVIIFLSLVFFRRDGERNSPISEIAALGALNNNRLPEAAQTAAFTEINGRLDAIQSSVVHNNDLAELRALYTQACATDSNVTQQAFNVSNLINTTRTDTLLNLKDAALQLANCCCDIRTGQDQIRLEAVQNTNSIIANDTANSQRIIDKLTENEIARLRDELADARLSNSQCMQNAYLVNTLRPYPAPAFTSFNPAVPYAIA